METEQIDKRVTWLDEQRRKDAEDITRLEERLEALDQAARQNERQLRDLASELARISALEARIKQFDETISKHRSEILQQLDTQDERRIAREKQLDSMRIMDQKKIAEEVDELRSLLKDLGPIKDALEIRRQEEMRISRAIDGIDKKVDQAAGQIADEKRFTVGIREARDSDNLRISELESGASGQAKRLDELRGFLDSFEDQLRKLATRAEVIEVSEKELRQSQSLWTEQQAARLAEFQRAWNTWETRFSEFEIQSDELQDRMEASEETNRSLRLLRDELKDVIERLERRISEVSEIQRLGEDRFKQEWATFRADEQKRWSSFKLSSEEQWKEHERQHRPIPEDIKELQDRLTKTQENIQDIERSSRGRISDLVDLVHEWGAELREGDE